MFEILTITGLIFSIIAVGFNVVRLELFSKADIHALGLFVINFALPAPSLIDRAGDPPHLPKAANRFLHAQELAPDHFVEYNDFYIFVEGEIPWRLNRPKSQPISRRKQRPGWSTLPAATA